MKKCIFTITILYLFIPINSYAQGTGGSAAIPFLLASTYAEANGMGETSIAIDTDNPLASIFNPAHLGMQSLRTYFSAGMNTSDWLPKFNLDLKYKTYAINAGLNLGKQFGFSPDFSIGLGYSQVYYDAGEFVITDETDPTPLGTFRAYDWSDQWTIGVGLDYWIRVSAGFTFKHITSELGPNATASINATDYGMLLNIPIMDVLSQSLQSTFEIYPNVNPILDFSFGFSRNNLGDKVFYKDPEQADPLPRTARVAIGLEIGAIYKLEDLNWKVFLFKWTVEENDRLVVRDTASSRWNYQSGFGDINIFKDLILGYTNSKIGIGNGWELSFLEIAYIRGGRYEQTNGNLFVNTTGFGFRLSGVFKLLLVLNPKISLDKNVDFIFKHFDLRYNQSTYEHDELNNAINGTKFHGVSLVFTN